MMDPRYVVRDCSELLSPSLLIYPKVVRENLKTMIAMADGADRLRRHVKTHKMAEIVRLAESLGIHRHKCATIAEAEMVATAGGADVLLAYPLVGPNVKRFIQLARAYRATTFRATVDHPDAARALSSAALGLEQPIPVLIDLEVGMGRTGILPRVMRRPNSTHSSTACRISWSTDYTHTTDTSMTTTSLRGGRPQRQASKCARFPRAAAQARTARAPNGRGRDSIVSRP